MEVKKCIRRGITLLGLSSFAVLGACSDGDSGSSGNPLTVSPAANLTSAQDNYDSLCVSCHLADGTGTTGDRDLTDITPQRYSLASLEAKIRDTMPQSFPPACEGDCAEDTAALVLCNFNPEVTDGCSEVATAIVVPPAADLTAGAASYGSMCAGCHLADGTGSSPSRDVTDILPYDYATDSGYTFDSLTAKIHDTMPKASPATCQNDCAIDTSAHILCSFNPDVAEGCL